MQLRRFAIAAIACVAWAHASAQGFPTKPVRIVVPFPPGGTADAISREIAVRLPSLLGQQVVIENRSGANGMLGAESMVRAEPDGHTIGIFSSSHAATPFATKLPFDPVKDATPVSLIVIVPGLLSVHPTVAATNLSELLALARAKPGALAYGNPGSLSAGHLAMEMLKVQAKLDILPIAYRGGAPALMDLVGGPIQMGISGPTAHLPHVKSGKLRAIATTGLKRSSAVPEVPTIAETIPGFELNEWYGFFAPAKAPREAITRLNQAVIKVIQIPEVRARFISLGAEPVGNTPEEFGAFFRSEMDKLGKLITSLGLKAE